MTDEQREQIQSLLADHVDNMKTPSGYSSHKDFKRQWLSAVADVALKMVEESQP